jgi:hypothetical protein
MTYFLLYGVFALWVVFDSLNRRMRMKGILWALASWVFGPIVLPLYLAFRPLKSGEVREGGTAWNILKNFAILWTVATAIMGVVSLVPLILSAIKSGHVAEWEGLSFIFRIGVFAAMWFFPTAAAALLGFLLRKNSIVETGPTGQLTTQSSTVTPIGGWAGVAIAAFVGLITISIANAFLSSRVHSVGTTVKETDLQSIPAPLTAKADNDWELVDTTDPMDNTPKITLMKSGTNDSELIIRCAKHKTEAFINTKKVIDNGEVRIKFDQGQPLRQSWSKSTDYTALFAPDAISFARELADAKTFMIEFTPFQEGERSISFDVLNLGPKLKPISDACNWAGVDESRARTKAASIALRARLEQYVHLCDVQSIGKWCWSDPNDVLFKNDSGYAATREKALDDAVQSANMGLAFKKQ